MHKGVVSPTNLMVDCLQGDYTCLLDVPTFLRGMWCVPSVCVCVKQESNMHILWCLKITSTTIKSPLLVCYPMLVVRLGS
jgi:hypothetical protein